MADISKLIQQINEEQNRTRKSASYLNFDYENINGEKGEETAGSYRTEGKAGKDTVNSDPDEVNLYLLERIINDDHNEFSNGGENSVQIITETSLSLKKNVKSIKKTHRELSRYQIIKQSVPVEKMYNASRRIFQLAGIRIRDLQPLEHIFSSQIANVREMNENLVTLLMNSRYVINNFEDKIKAAINESAANYELRMIAGRDIPEYEKSKAVLIDSLRRIQETDKHFKANPKYRKNMTELIELENKLLMQKINVDVTADSDENLAKGFNHMLYLNAIGHCAYKLGIRIANNHRDYYNTLKNCKDMYFMSRNIAKAINIIAPHIAKLDEYINNIENDVITGLTEMNTILTQQRSPSFLMAAGYIPQQAAAYLPGKK